MGRVLDRSFRIVIAVGLIGWIAWMVGVQTEYEYQRIDEPATADAPAVRNDEAPPAEPHRNPWAYERADEAAPAAPAR